MDNEIVEKIKQTARVEDVIGYYLKKGALSSQIMTPIIFCLIYEYSKITFFICYYSCNGNFSYFSN